jgi:hypothetical protein
VSLKGGVEWGSLLTRPLSVEAPELRVNADAWRGRVAAEVLDADSGQPLPGYAREESVPVMEDGIDQALRWKGKGDLQELMGRQVQVRFWLWQSELYAFWMADREP